jgi:hypothetical protein
MLISKHNQITIAISNKRINNDMFIPNQQLTLYTPNIRHMISKIKQLNNPPNTNNIIANVVPLLRPANRRRLRVQMN